ncbi:MULTISPECIES: DegT/DnrJ/EryC1/StrS family aminotransferase [unclassified Imperialibacter]|uniref:DegT/DnrJ/EryC1/StrS family aminotransferase n=1 Tax=unclassified Imperialibacter TaxID=2629706 RepID=UPI0012585F2E|nr:MULTISPECIES: DegT/DnrJ/EryC1/StrS family aminotransferase [unclassified Imperialibacter]CAD5252912.1 TDP-4-oxo-6-deoxy-D-glucose transaminase [Imperialibacter sp. 89]CAD5261077.1 TDP-4-oxo-6-deoxy-D-glucose transaminase [Imperialibacter sp. 75]VVT03714.1 TDP-4-oxo-6-deoxy-D-glucose transaminase [Imperialibacter sp. EC-SDR9]
MVITNPDKYLLPTYRLSPFSTADVALNHELPSDDYAETYFGERFASRRYKYCMSGRAAIHQALSHYHLQPDDVVTIITTTNNFYISSCVTNEIERFCKWSRKIEQATKVLFVNHEFGYPLEDVAGLQEHGLPIIEDCAYSFLSHNTAGNTGLLGDFTIYSFPKIFPVQIGGLLTMKEGLDDEKFSQHPLPNQEHNYIQKVASHFLRKTADIASQRIENYHFLINGLTSMGFSERISLSDGIVPGACLFSVNGLLNLPELKEALWEKGIQCSIFYGEDTFFIPVHQALKKPDLTYFLNNIKINLK